MKFNKVLTWSVVILPLITTGCVHETTEGASHIFTYELWVPICVFLGGIALAAVGWFLHKKKKLARLAWTSMILGPAGVIFFAPSLFRDRAVVDDTSFSLRTGIWGMSVVHEVEYDNLKRIRLISEEETGRYGRKSTYFYLICETKDGLDPKVPVNNKISQAAAPYFIQNAVERGIPFIDEQ